MVREAIYEPELEAERVKRRGGQDEGAEAVRDFFAGVEKESSLFLVLGLLVPAYGIGVERVSCECARRRSTGRKGAAAAIVAYLHHIASA